MAGRRDETGIGMPVDRSAETHGSYGTYTGDSGEKGEQGSHAPEETWR